MQCFWGESAFAKVRTIIFFETNRKFFTAKRREDHPSGLCRRKDSRSHLQKHRRPHRLVLPSIERKKTFSEVTEVGFDPAKISYRQVLDFFWSHHDPSDRRKKQYQSAILYVDDEQKAIAEETLEEAKKKYPFVETYVVPLDKFYQAEDYHQKYWLRNKKDIFDEVRESLASLSLQLHLSDEQVATSVLATKLNSYAAGYDDFSELEELKKEHKLSDGLVERITTFAKKGGDPRACH